MIIMHTANKAEYDNEIKTGYYGKKSLERDGFVHCSDIDTYYMVAPNFKDDHTERVILVIDTDKLDCRVKWEDGGHFDYPHIYVLLNEAAIIRVLPHLWSESREWVPNEELNDYAVNGFHRSRNEK